MKKEIKKIIKQWLESSGQYVDILTDDLDTVCMDGFFNFEELINKFYDC